MSTEYDFLEGKLPTGGVPGEARCPGPSTRDIILDDKDGVPEAIVTEAYEFLGDEDIPFDRYTSQEFFDLEMEKMWPKVWQFACREEQIPDVGDTITYDVGRYSTIIVRIAPDKIKAFVNSCPHRGMQLRPSESFTCLKQFRCPFHGFTWELDGTLKNVPCEWDFPHISPESHGLDEVKSARWGGFVFINMDPDAKPLEDYLEVLPDHFKNWPLDQRFTTLHIQKTLPSNWKLAQEAFLEAYHVLATHPQGVPTAGDANAQYDVFGDNVTRFVHTIGYPSPHMKKPMTQQDILSALGGDDLGLKIEGDQTARDVWGAYLRKSLGEQFGIDLSKYSNSEMMDSIEYHCFPNFFMFPGISLPMVYRFRPNGEDVNSSIFDLIFLQPLKEGEKAPQAPQPHVIDIETSFTKVPGMRAGLDFIYDQDTWNLDMQTKGIKASRKKGQTLGNYQEIRTRRIHMTLDKYLSA